MTRRRKHDPETLLAFVCPPDEPDHQPDVDDQQNASSEAVGDVGGHDGEGTSDFANWLRGDRGAVALMRPCTQRPPFEADPRDLT